MHDLRLVRLCVFMCVRVLSWRNGCTWYFEQGWNGPTAWGGTILKRPVVCTSQTKARSTAKCNTHRSWLPVVVVFSTTWKFRLTVQTFWNRQYTTCFVGRGNLPASLWRQYLETKRDKTLASNHTLPSLCCSGTWENPHMFCDQLEWMVSLLNHWIVKEK